MARKKAEHKPRPRSGSTRGQTSNESPLNQQEDSVNHQSNHTPNQPRLVYLQNFDNSYIPTNNIVIIIFTFAAILTVAWAITLTYFSKVKDVWDYARPLDVSASQLGSLRSPYQLNYEKLLLERERNMEKYSFPYSKTGVDKRSKLSLQEFRDIYDGKWPVVITDVMPSWAAMNWSGEFFFENYGNERVTMKTVNLDLDLAISKVMPGLLDLGPHDIRLNDFDLLSQGNLDTAVSLALPLHLFYKNAHISSEHTWAYVEDELFIPMRPQLRRDIGDCDYLKEDYFSVWPEEVRPWNAMLLWGTSFSRSSLHIDPYNWTGTNAVIRGRKLWKLYPPGQDHLLYVKNDRLSGFPLDCYKYNSPVDAFNPELERYPSFEKAKALDLEQLPGELLIIPTGWFHQAFNAEETIAVSSQVMNSNNWRIVLEEVLKIGHNVPRQKLRSGIDSLSPEQQVKKVMEMLPRQILHRGKAVTQDVLNQIEHGYENSRGMIP